MDYGLGLVLSFTDNATAGINNAVNSLNQLTQIAENATASLNEMASLSALSVVSDRIGSAFLSAGKGIMSTLTGVIGEINKTGQTLYYAENQLNALYAGSDRTGKQVIADIQQYAKTSMFEFENLIPAVTSLKSVGIEAFDSITSSQGTATYSLLDYASALASFAPQMRNAYGTGINAAIGAMREYIAEGNKMSLKRGAGLDITQIIGEDKGATIEDRTRQVADLIEQLGMLGMVDMMKNSPMVKLSNMGDVLFQFKGMVSESGVYDAINGLIDIFANFVNGIDESRLQTIAQNVGSALTSLIKPVEWLSKMIVKLADGFVKILEKDPLFARLVITFTAISGALLLLGGVLLKFTSAFSGISLMWLAFGKNFNTIATLFKTGSLKILGTLLPLTLTLGLLFLAWKSDFAGIRSSLTSFVTNLSNSFKTARQAVSGSVGDMRTKLAELNTKNDFFSNTTRGLMKIMMAVEAVSDAWDDFTLSEDNYLKAKELGILPLIEAILDLKYRFGFFKKGFIDGWTEMSNKLKSMISGMGIVLKGLGLEKLVDGISNLLQALANNDPKAWETIGYYAGKASIFLMGIVIVLKLIDKAIGVVAKLGGFLNGLSTIGNAVSKVFSVFGKLISKMFPNLGRIFSGGFINTIKNAIPKIIPAIKGLFATVKSAIVGLLEPIATALGISVTTLFWIIVLVLASVISYAVKHWEDFKGKMLSIWTTIKDEASSIWDSITSGLKRVWDNLVNTMTPLIDSLKVLWEKLKELWDMFKGSYVVQYVLDELSSIGEFLITVLVPIIKAAVRIVSAIIKDGWNLIVAVFNAIVSVIGTALTSVVDIISGVIDIIIGIFTSDWRRALDGVINIGAALLNLLISILKSIWNVLVTFVTGKINILFSIISGLGDILRGIIEGVVVWIVRKFESILNAGLTLWESFSSGIDKILSNMSQSGIKILSNMGQSIKNIWDGIKNTITNAIEGARDAVRNAIDKIKSFFDFDWQLPKIKLPHFNITGKFSLNPPSIPKLTVDWYEKGGIFDSPSIIGVGENGKEAVMPLEKNTSWIRNLASMLTSEIQSIRPISSGQAVNNNQGGSTQSYLTNNSNSTHHIQGDTDNSIVFNEGAIQIIAKDTSEAEAVKMAKMIMAYIKRQKELEDMTQYA